MMIDVYLDHNVWHFLFERRLDLEVELPREEFCIYLTREAEFEIRSVPEEEVLLKAFIYDTIAKCRIRTDLLFGFADESLPLDEQRVGGFDQGRWVRPKEADFILDQRRIRLKGAKRPTKLKKNEADISVAARSFYSIVLSLDGKPGPIKDAYRQGGKVVFLTDFDKSRMSLRDFIKATGQPKPRISR
jgi:hypothetical protein